MGKMIVGITAASIFWIAFICPAPFPAFRDVIGVSTALALEDFSYRDNEILELFTHEHNMEHFAHLNGMLTNLWKTERTTG